MTKWKFYFIGEIFLLNLNKFKIKMYSLIVNCFKTKKESRKWLVCIIPWLLLKMTLSNKGGIVKNVILWVSNTVDIPPF